MQPALFPYGIADYELIRHERMLYVDRTGHIRSLDRLGRSLVFLRPRRFGKSLWLRTLASDYDLRRAKDFDWLFGDLDIGREPTPEHGCYFVLDWNFSTVDPGGDVTEVRISLAEHIRPLPCRSA